MNRQKKMNFLCKLIGKKNATRIQSKIKYLMNFRAAYSNTEMGAVSCDTCRTYVFMVDGKTRHGGLSDRLRGCFSVYDYCKENNYQFKIYWNYPDDLENYFLPAEVDWKITDKDMQYNKNIVDFKFFNTYTMLEDDPISYAELLQSKKRIVHVYSNLTMNEKNYKDDFNQLFRTAPIIEDEVEKCLKQIGSDYISITFRFIGCLGDFKDRPDLYPPLATEQEKKEYVDACIAAVKKVKNENPDIKTILVTSDSVLFLNEACKLNYVYIIPGTLQHMDVTNERTNLSQKKSFLDFLLISKAKKSYSYAYGKMFNGSKFARTAALISGRNVIEVK